MHASLPSNASYAPVHMCVCARACVCVPRPCLRLLREYLALEFGEIKVPFAMDVERIVDDFVLFCIFVGNDFLPCELPLEPSMHEQ